jgi:hypothetical protein
MSVKYLAAVLDEHCRDPNPARSRRVRLPHEETEELNPPVATHVEAVYGLLARPYRLPTRVTAGCRATGAGNHGSVRMRAWRRPGGCRSGTRWSAGRR